MKSPMTTELGEKLSEKELCPDDLLAGQEAAFARDVERLLARRAEFVAVPCPACGHNDASDAFEKLGFHYVDCRRCATLYMSPRPASWGGSSRPSSWTKPRSFRVHKTRRRLPSRASRSSPESRC